MSEMVLVVQPVRFFFGLFAVAFNLFFQQGGGVEDVTEP